MESIHTLEIMVRGTEGEMVVYRTQAIAPYRFQIGELIKTGGNLARVAQLVYDLDAGEYIAKLTMVTGTNTAWLRMLSSKDSDWVKAESFEERILPL